MRIRFRTAALLTLFAGVAAFVAVDAAKETTEVASPSKSQTRTADAVAQKPSAEVASQPAFSLPERPGLGAAQSRLFESQTWQPPPPPPAKQPPPPPPSAPALPFTFAGKLIQDGRLSILLSRGDSVIPVRLGETVDGTYKVEAITDTEVTLVYLPLGQRQTLPVISALTSPAAAIVGAATSASASGGGSSARAQPGAPLPSSNVIGQPPLLQASTPATLAWAGPPQVKLGSRFEVTLRVSSSQPLSAWPMQLRFDPEQLEVVTVKPGKLPGASDPNFSYRVSPNGSIFVGASLRQPAPAADAELLALTLRPLKAAPAAEVAIASLSLHGAAGSPIPHDNIAAFRTAITP